VTEPSPPSPPKGAASATPGPAPAAALPEEAARALGPTPFLDYDHPAVAAYAARHGRGATARERAVALVHAVRDGLRYTPWNVASAPEGFRASVVAQREEAEGGHCVDKAVLVAACARRLGIPARLHFANVRNHLGTEALERQLGTDLLVFHGYVELWLGGRWVAATPAFNRALCERLGVAPLDFDGEHDSIFQPWDRAAGRFMERVHDHGSFDDLPYERMVAAWREHYPRFAAAGAWPRPPRPAQAAPRRG
jgi:transglutaminase-like putative cysteine protease